MFTPYLFWKLFGFDLEFSPPHRADVFCAGSIAGSIPEGFKGNILGTGIMHGHHRYELRSAKVWGLRGHLSRQRIECKGNPALGDPGLLARLFAKPAEKRFALGVVPHYADKADPKLASAVSIDIQGDIETVIQSIAECEQILSSSLHGLIIADSLGVPNQWLKLSDKLDGADFKFRDYYSVYGIEPQAVTEIAPVKEWERPGLEDVYGGVLQSFMEFAARNSLVVTLPTKG